MYTLWKHIESNNGMCDLEDSLLSSYDTAGKVEDTVIENKSCLLQESAYTENYHPALDEINDYADCQYNMGLRVLIIIMLCMSTVCLMYIWGILLYFMKSQNFSKIEENGIKGNDKDEEGECKEEEEDSFRSYEQRSAGTNNSTRKETTHDVVKEHSTIPSTPSLVFGLGDTNYKKACRLSEMIIIFVNDYMNYWYKKVTIGEEDITHKWHPYLLTNDIEISGFIMIRIMNSRLLDISAGLMEYIAVILSSAIFHALLKGPRQIMNDLTQLYSVRLPSNCVSIYKIKRIRSYNENALKIAYSNHIKEVQVNSDEKARIAHFDKLPDMDKIRAYNEEMKKLVLQILSEIDWKEVLRTLSRIYNGHDEEDNESDYCLSPRRVSADSELEYRRSLL